MRIEVNNPSKILSGDARRAIYAPTGIDFIVSEERKFNVRLDGSELVITSNGDTFDRIRIEPVAGNAIIIK